MAEIAYTKPEKGAYHQTFKWTGVTEADTFAPVRLDRPINAYTIQVSGTFGGSTVALHGSLDASTFAAMKDANGVAIGLTAAGLATGGTLVLALKPVASGGTSASLTVTLMVGYLP